MKKYILHLHRYESETYVTESDNYLIFDDFDKCVEFAKDFIEKYIGSKFESLDFKFENNLHYAEAFIYKNGFDEIEYNAEFGSEIHKSDNYRIKCQKINTWNEDFNGEW